MSLPIDRLSRRQALKLGLAAGAGCITTQVFGQGTSPEGAIDAHVHVWTPDVKRYPLAKGFQVSDMQPPRFTPAELLAEARPVGVERIVLIQMNFYGYDNRYMLDAIRDYPGVFSGVAIIDEHAGDVAARMKELKQQGVRGFRLYAIQEPFDAWLSNEGLAEMWKVGGEVQLAMCGLVGPAALEPIDKMCSRYPDTPVVIDHFGRIGLDGTIGEADLNNLCRLARHKHTHVKVSAFYALGKKQAPYTDLGPMIRRLLDAFGPERLMWATDCPYQVQNGHTYRDSIELIRSRLDYLSASDRQWILRKTAEKVFFS
jgi:predicted TIM-barrel fold metal-dependent hydrolase